MSLRRPSIRKQTALHCGWLTKQGGMVKSWKPRWFAIRGDHIYYYQKEDEIKLLGDIPLPGNEVVELPANPDEPGKYFFQIKPGKDRSFVNPNHAVYVLYAKSESERQEWISVIHRVMFSHLGGGVFGQSIQESMEYERRSNTGRVVPRIVEESISYIREHGLEVEGVFRLPGAAGTVRRMKQEYNSAQPCTLDPDGYDVHSVASLLKLYLRELPEPVIPFKYYEDFTTMGLKLQWDPGAAMALLHDKLTQLPRDNYNCLKFICCFLHDLCAKSELNRMTDSNIAMMFGPNLMRTDDDNPMLMLSTADLNTLTVRTLISDYEKVFKRDYYDSVVSQRRGGMPDINNMDDFDLLTGDGSPGSSGLPSPMQPARSLDNLSRNSSNSSLNDDSELTSSRDDISSSQFTRDMSPEPVSFRVNSVGRTSRKQLRRFNILSTQTKPDVPTRTKPEPPPRRKPEVPPRTCSAVSGSSNDSSELETVEPIKSPVTPIIEQRTPSIEEVPFVSEVTIFSPEIMKGPLHATPPKPPPRIDLLPRNSQPERTRSSAQSGESSIPAEQVTDIDDVIRENHLDSSATQCNHHDQQQEIDALRSEVEKMKKVQSNLGRIYQKQMDAQLADLESTYEKKIEMLNEKLKNEKQATNLAVERLAQVQGELNKYQCKFGPLEDDSDEG